MNEPGESSSRAVFSCRAMIASRSKHHPLKKCFRQRVARHGAKGGHRVDKAYVTASPPSQSAMMTEPLVRSQGHGGARCAGVRTRHAAHAHARRAARRLACAELAGHRLTDKDGDASAQRERAASAGRAPARHAGPPKTVGRAQHSQARVAARRHARAHPHDRVGPAKGTRRGRCCGATSALDISSSHMPIGMHLTERRCGCVEPAAAGASHRSVIAGIRVFDCVWHGV